MSHPSHSHSQKHSRGSQEHSPASTQEQDSMSTIIRPPIPSFQGL
jgi:hypothetical protein